MNIHIQILTIQLLFNTQHSYTNNNPLIKNNYNNTNNNIIIINKYISK